MEVYYCRYLGDKAKIDVNMIGKIQGVKIVNEILPHLLVVQVEQQALSSFKNIDDWVLQVPQTVNIDTQLSIDYSNTLPSLPIVKLVK